MINLYRKIEDDVRENHLTPVEMLELQTLAETLNRKILAELFKGRKKKYHRNSELMKGNTRGQKVSHKEMAEMVRHMRLLKMNPKTYWTEFLTERISLPGFYVRVRLLK